jgi:NAD-dependent SIR2 family protein deacetylase
VKQPPEPRSKLDYNFREGDIMGKYDNMIVFKETKARVSHACSKCRKEINPGDVYYAEELKDKFLQSLHRKKYCPQCYQSLKPV